MNELSGNEDTKNNEGGNGPNRINYNRFFPVRTIRHLIRDESRSALIRCFQFCIRHGLCIYGTLSEVDILFTPFTCFTIFLQRLCTFFEPVTNHPGLGKREGEENPNCVKRNKPACIASKGGYENRSKDRQNHDAIREDQFVSARRKLPR